MLAHARKPNVLHGPELNMFMNPSFFSAMLSNFMAEAPATPLTSAPAEKNLPSPVKTVKTVSGCSLSLRIASIVSTMSLPPNEFKDFGRLNYAMSEKSWHPAEDYSYLDYANLSLDLHDNVVIIELAHRELCYFWSRAFSSCLLLRDGGMEEMRQRINYSTEILESRKKVKI
jgi:hypothetical protein